MFEWICHSTNGYDYFEMLKFNHKKISSSTSWSYFNFTCSFLEISHHTKRLTGSWCGVGNVGRPKGSLNKKEYNSKWLRRFYRHINDHVNDFHDDKVWHFIVTCHFGEKMEVTLNMTGVDDQDNVDKSKPIFKIVFGYTRLLRLVSVRYMYLFQFEVQ